MGMMRVISEAGSTDWMAGNSLQFL